MLGIYIHIPFCIKKCLYCDFVSTEQTSLIGKYLDALIIEIELTGKMYSRMVDSVFLGGGTPSLLSGGEIARILDALENHFRMDGDREVTMEANPGTLTEDKLKAYKDAGVNRISLGLQCAQNESLRMLGRQHTVEEFEASYEKIRKAGFENINIDLIYALPGQAKDDVEDTLRFVLQKRPEHVSAYALHMEKGTPMYEMAQMGEVEEVSEEDDLEQYHLIQQQLDGRGYRNYEISNFAIPGYECKHNLKYWNLVDYLGLGAAAHSCIDRVRFANTSNIAEYIRQLANGKLQYPVSELVDDRNRKIEYLMLKLRLKGGFSLYDYKSKFGEDFLEKFQKEFQSAAACGLIAYEDGNIIPTAKGFDLQNVLVGKLIQNI